MTDEQHSDEYYLAMAALDNYEALVRDRLPKSTSVVFRIHQLGHALERALAAPPPEALTPAPDETAARLVEDIEEHLLFQHDTPDEGEALLQRCLPLLAPEALTPEEWDDIGLSIDMTDVDRLRQWANNLLGYGPDVTHWASVPHLVNRMQVMATEMEKAIAAIGRLRRRRPVVEGK